MSKQSIIKTYSDTFGIAYKEVLEWVKSYIHRPGEFPRLIEAGLIEDTKGARKESIQAYLQSEVDNSTAGRIRSQLDKERAESE